MLPSPQQPVVLAGRRFVPVGESTVEHDGEVMRLLRRAGVSFERSGVGEEFAYEVLATLVETNTLLPLVACMIVPEAAAPRRPGRFVRFLERVGILERSAVRGGWSPEVAAETVAFLKQLDEPEDKTKVYALVAALLVPFLNGALRSWRPSPRSSGSPPAAAPDPNGSSSSAGATSGPGEGSSASSPGSIPTASPG